SVGRESVVPSGLADTLETVRRNVELEARLIDDLLDLTRITHGKLELYRAPVRVGQIVPEVGAKGIMLVSEIENPGEILVVDGARVTQILWNLLKNAIKFTPASGTI